MAGREIQSIMTFFEKRVGFAKGALSLYGILISMRPRQWIKNIFVFPALLFSQSLFNPMMVGISLAAFVILCLASGGVFLLNDVIDIESDRKHPKKAKRPIASGKLGTGTAIFTAIFLVAGALVLSYLLNLTFALTLLLYLAIQFAYSFYLKGCVILDIFCVASGFFLRVAAGAEAIDVPISSWLLICTIFISLFLSLAKRRHELALLGENAMNHRRVLEEYSPGFLDQMVSIVAAGTIISYSLYTLSAETTQKFHTKNLWLTIPIVLFGAFRYLYCVYHRGEGGRPEMIVVEDKPMLGSIVLYGFIVIIILYF
jgi:4-hydroxybenzoate polyprenyltransferase